MNVNDITRNYMHTIKKHWSNINAEYLYGHDATNVYLYKNEIIFRINRRHEMIDFDLILFIRYIYLSNSFKLLSNIRNDIDFWLWRDFEDRVTAQCFWTETHTICYLSSAKLLLENKNFYKNKLLNENHERLDKCLHAWIDTRLKFGFTEYKSPVYLPYTLESLLNVMDFSNDTLIKPKILKLINRILEFFTYGFPDDCSTIIAQARTYPQYINNPTNRNVNEAIAILRGLSKKRYKQTRLVSNLLTSDYFIFYITTVRYDPDKLYRLSHELNLNFTVKHYEEVIEQHGLNKDDKLMFMWTNGMFFHTDTVSETARMLSKYNLWEHKHFKSLKMLRYFYYILPILTYTVKPLANGGQYLPVAYEIHSTPNLCISFIRQKEKEYFGFQKFPFACRIYDESIYFIANQISEISMTIINNRLPRISYNPDEDMFLIQYKPNLLTPMVGSKVYIKILDQYRIDDSTRAIVMTKNDITAIMFISTNYTIVDGSGFVSVDKFWFNVRLKFFNSGEE